MRDSLSILAVSGAFPSQSAPNNGVFVKHRIKGVADKSNHRVEVLSPIPYFPRIGGFGRWSQWSNLPRNETFEGLSISRPRYAMIPKVGGYFQAHSMFRAAWRELQKLHAERRFELIDAHFAYPGGAIGSELSRRLGIPLVITGRGEDILRFPTLPVIGRQIRSAVRRATRLVALSEEIADAFVMCGADKSKISVIPNGIDERIFSPVGQLAARRQLKLPETRKIVISVGNCQERKGFHLLVDALPKVRRVYPEAMLVIVGGPPPYGNDYTGVVNDRIKRNNVFDNVILAGAVAHDELGAWYSAADVFALMSSREGSPNVLLEARACGLPAVATPVGGIPQELADPQLGVLLQERSADAAAKGIISALNTQWDRHGISASMRSRTWSHVANEVTRVFYEAIAAHAATRGASNGSN